MKYERRLRRPPRLERYVHSLVRWLPTAELPAIFSGRLLSAALIGVLVFGSSLSAETIVERMAILDSEHPTAFRPRPWNMNMAQTEGGARARGTCVWLNTDWQATPWAGVRFEAEDAPTLQVTEDWIERGFIRLHINVTKDRHGNIGAGDQYSLAKSLYGILAHAADGHVPSSWRSVEVTEGDGRLAPNVLVSRRSHRDDHAILLHNRNRYERTVRVAVPGLQGDWQVRDALTGSPPRAMSGRELSAVGVEVDLAPAGPAVILLEKRDEK